MKSASTRRTASVKDTKPAIVNIEKFRDDHFKQLSDFFGLG